ncbi:hypothetical protein BJY04DRAFT_100297 [Aspergillus karnatakaensis]|uniref:uncharacterized protein n=1 Tax=Aspergillus karnatakaensis TaxID=1810916 RepID=UPI003CCD2278
MRMDQTPSDRLSSHLDALRPPSSTSPRQRWSHLSSSSPSLTQSQTATSSPQPNPCRHEPALNETSRAHRTTALRHLNGTPKPLSWKTRQAANNTGSGRSSSLVSQPVLVRSYSGGSDDKPGASKMPTRRSFLFPGSSNSQRREPELPSDEEFSIDGILRAIEPNVRGTLDSIGEICGRSKLSLANEYGSHIAPLGEIRAPPGLLLPVEEASSDHEGYSGDNIVIYDDENADGREHSPFSNYTFFDTILPPISAPLQSTHITDQPDESRLDSLPTTREFASKPRTGGRALLGTTVTDADNRVQNILTPALVSEILLDAQANGRLKPNLTDQLSQTSDMPSQWTDPKPSDVPSLFRWLKQAAWNDSSESARQTAEMRLRAMLERQNEQASS